MIGQEVDAKVARVLSDTRLVINAGANEGVTAGDTVTIWELIPVEDPDTGELLGDVRVPRVTLNVESVQAKLAVARVPNEPGFHWLFQTGGGGPRPVTRLSAKPVGEGSGAVHVPVGCQVTVRLKSSKPAE